MGEPKHYWKTVDKAGVEWWISCTERGHFRIARNGKPLMQFGDGRVRSFRSFAGAAKVVARMQVVEARIKKLQATQRHGDGGPK